MESHGGRGRLAAVELAAIDLTITAVQAAGNTGNAGKDDNPREQMGEALGEMHGHFVNLTDNDKQIIGQIKTLAAKLSSRLSLQQLEKARGEVVRGNAG
jgi:hypothetical protein